MSSFVYHGMRKAVGDPTALLVKPVANWGLPVVTTYEAKLDRFRNVAGATIEPAGLWKTRTLEILPSTHTRETQALIAVGELPEDSADFYVYGATDIAAVQACYGIILGSKLYRVAEVVPTPHDNPQWALVRIYTR